MTDKTQEALHRVSNCLRQNFLESEWMAFQGDIETIRAALSQPKEHQCPDWDYDTIREGDPEMECCTCFAKPTPSQPTYNPEAHILIAREDVPGIVEEALQDMWNDWCADTGCYPDDFKYRKGKLFFEAGKWASNVGKRVAALLAQKTEE